LAVHGRCRGRWGSKSGIICDRSGHDVDMHATLYRIYIGGHNYCGTPW
jgi:hypothetical protein